MLLALVGNQNSGKTTLYNAMSGRCRRVGNFPGVTIDVETSAVSEAEGAEIVDLPGVYSLRPYSEEERVTREYLLRERPDGIINVVDATCPERGLYLTMRVLELGIPTVVALNMMDEVERDGGSVDTGKLGSMLGVPVVPISAARRDGVGELLKTACSSVRSGQKTTAVTESLAFDYVVQTSEHIISPYAEKAGLPLRFAATLAIEGDPDVTASLGLDDKDSERLRECVRNLERKTGHDAVTSAVMARYDHVDDICRKCVRQTAKKRSLVDAAVLNKFFAYPVFAAVIAIIFYLTFEVIGKRLSSCLSAMTETVTALAGEGLRSVGVHPTLVSLVTDGVFAGVGAVVSFLPVVMTLFFFLSILEDTGYMARAAFIMDAPMRGLGLSGKSIVPLIFGFGCSVPAVMSARTLPTERDRHVTVMLVPYMSCGAKIPIYALFASAFFPDRQADVIGALYAGGVTVAVVTAILYHRLMPAAPSAEYILELPPWRLPTVHGVLRLMMHKAGDFLSRAFTVIFLASVAVWFFSTFDAHFHVAYDQGESLLAAAGRLIAPVFAPLGFGDWRAAAALLTGLTAKESVVGTFAVLLGPGAGPDSIFTPASALSFLTFALLYTPCAAAVSAMKKELGGWRPALRVIAAGLIAAWCASAVVYRLALYVL